MYRQMLYRTGSALKWEDLSLDFVVVDADISGEVDRYLADGWVMHPYDTRETVSEAPKKRGRPPKVRNELD